MNIKISNGIRENGIFVGNNYDKYGSGNFIVKRIMRGFESTLHNLVLKTSPRSIHEIGCGEGYWVLRWNEQGYSVKGYDFSKKIIEIARENAITRGFLGSLFELRSIYELQAEDSADLIVCCEVLEHLEDPDAGLRVLQQITGRNLIVSVPQEPLWRVLNLARGRYMLHLGNTPGHIQHWSSKSFVTLVSKYFHIIAVRKPLPWTMLLCQPK